MASAAQPQSSASSALPSPHCIDYFAQTERFSIRSTAEVERALAHLHEHGYAVWSDVGSPDENEHAHSLFWLWAESTYPNLVRRDDEASWAHLPISANTGACWGGGVGNSEFAWHIRSLPNLRKVFEEIWQGETDLVASLDGCGVLRPTQHYDSGPGSFVRSEKLVTRRTSFHVDQSPLHKPGRECVQGLYSVFEQDHTTGGIVFVPGSHRVSFPSLAALVKDPKSRNDFVDVRPWRTLQSNTSSLHASSFGHESITPSTARGTQRPRLIRCGPGDLVTWDSRTIHFPSPALRDVIWNERQKEVDKAAAAAASAEKQRGDAQAERKDDESASAASAAPSAAAAAPSLDATSFVDHSTFTCSPSAAAAADSSSAADSAPSAAASASAASSRIPRLQRLVSYQCMTPASKITAATRDEYTAARLSAVAEGHTVASHWPHSWTDYKLKKRLAREPHTPIVLTAEQRALVVGRERAQAQ